MSHSQTILLLITHDPSHPLSEHALRYATSFFDQYGQLEAGSAIPRPSLKVFFYADAAATANGYRWQMADQMSLTKEWQKLSAKYKLSLPVCVSTALARGVTDSDNAHRHQLGDQITRPSADHQPPNAIDIHNLASGFALVGLGELAALMGEADRVIQF